MNQLQALGDVTAARAAMAAAVQKANQVNSQAASAAGDLAAAEAAHHQAIAATSAASQRLATLAIAAYTGEGNLAPVTDPATSTLPGVLGPGVGASPSGGPLTLSASMEAADAGVLLEAVVSEAQSSLTTDRKQVVSTGKAIAAAKKRDARASGAANKADRTAKAAQKLLKATLAAATTPGMAPPTLPADAVQSPPVTLAGTGVVNSPAIVASGNPAASATAPPTGASEPSPTVLGPPVLTAAELAGWFTSTGRTANATVPIAQLAADYLTAAHKTGVRGDIAFAQSIVETGYFSFPSYGQVTPADNNFAGIGACNSCAHGWSFPNAQTGVSAQLELLDAYASPVLVPTPLVGHVGVGGCCPAWMALSGTWATNPNYGVEILTIYKQMLDWAIPGRLAAAGLGPAVAAPAAHTGAAAAAPVLAPLPAGSRTTASTTSPG